MDVQHPPNYFAALHLPSFRRQNYTPNPVEIAMSVSEIQDSICTAMVLDRFSSRNKFRGLRHCEIQLISHWHRNRSGAREAQRTIR
jgi:hypothetical protein